jgi:hypothetical protein
MSDKSPPSSDEPPGSPPDPSDPEGSPPDEYKVGPGRPPKETRWKKGGPSPNPLGAPRKDRAILDLRKALDRALNKRVKLSDGDKKLVLTQAEAGIEQLVRQFAKGDRYARRDLIEYGKILGIDFLASHKKSIEEALALAPNHQAILDEYVGRRTGAAETSAAEPVIAPPELLDDDVEEKPGAPPTAAAKIDVDPPPPPPLPDPAITYPKPFDHMSPMQKRAWYPEWWAQFQHWEARRKK